MYEKVCQVWRVLGWRCRKIPAMVSKTLKFMRGTSLTPRMAGYYSNITVSHDCFTTIPFILPWSMRLPNAYSRNSRSIITHICLPWLLRYASEICTGTHTSTYLTQKPSLTPYTWAEKFESFERINSIRETNENFDSCTHVNGWFPAVNMCARVKISVCFTYRIHPFETFEFFCSCIRGHCHVVIFILLLCLPLALAPLRCLQPAWRGPPDRQSTDHRRPASREADHWHTVRPPPHPPTPPPSPTDRASSFTDYGVTTRRHSGSADAEASDTWDEQEKIESF